MARDGSDWDYINEHMEGHDEYGLPNFISEPGFSDNYKRSSLEEKEDNELIKYMMLNLDWSYVIQGIYEAYENRGYLAIKEEKALRTMINRGLGQKPVVDLSGLVL